MKSVNVTDLMTPASLIFCTSAQVITERGGTDPCVFILVSLGNFPAFPHILVVQVFQYHLLLVVRHITFGILIFRLTCHIGVLSLHWLRYMSGRVIVVLLLSLYSDPLKCQPYFDRYRLTSLLSSSSESSAGEGRLDGLGCGCIVLAMTDASLIDLDSC